MRITLLNELFKLKKIPRTGWNDNIGHQRTTPDPESILSHTGGGMLMILFCLPDELSDTDRQELSIDTSTYSKDTILKMFLCHDLAEAYTGDLTPQQRTDVTKQNESSFNSMIDLFSTYQDFYKFNFYGLWEDFENSKTINGRVAKEIDVLENLLQLKIEFYQPGVSISDYTDWCDELERKVTTPMGKRILSMITEGVVSAYK